MNARERKAIRFVLVLAAGLVLLAPLSAQRVRLHVLAATGTAEEVQAALQGGADFNDHDWTGVTALMAAASTNRDPAVVTLLVRSAPSSTRATSTARRP